MAAELKVYLVTARDNVDAVVAAPSRAAASRALNAVGIAMTDHHLATYGYVTANDEDVEAAMSEPGAVFVRPKYSPDSPYTKVT